MKKTILFLLTVVSIYYFTYSQDIIYLKNGSDIKTRIIEISNDYVKYRNFEQPDGPLRNILVKEVFMIIYENGTREVFKTNDQDFEFVQKPVEPQVDYAREERNNQWDNQDLCFKGQQDAGRYYTGYREAATWTAATTIVGGIIIGVIPAIACSMSEPQASSLTVPNPELYKNSSYYQCYMQEAKRIKSKKVWTNFAIGAAIDIAVASLIISLSTSE